MRSQPVKCDGWLSFTTRMFLGLCIFLTGFGLFPLCAKGAQHHQFRIGFSISIFGEVNENDAVAAVGVWAREIARKHDIPVDTHPMIFRDVDSISQALKDQAVDCINLTTAEYVSVREHVMKENVVVAVTSDSFEEEYLLLVHRESGIEKLSDLRGRTLGLPRSSSASLVPAWLDILLAKNNMNRADDFFRQIIPAPNVGKTVLPVFFRKTDSCVATRKGYDTMVELNPQVGERLKILAVSPSVVPVLFCFRDDFDSPLRSRFMEQIINCHLFPACRQILTIFQTDRLEEHPVGCLNSAIELLYQYRRLSKGSKNGMIE